MQRLLREIALRLSLIVLSTLFTLIVFEVTLRLGGYMPLYALQIKELKGPEATLRIELNEQYLYTVERDSGPEINNFGYRGADFPPKSSRKRVLVIGDSFIMGNNLPLKETLPVQLENFLGPDYEVLNLGISGYGPDQEYLRFLDEREKLKPDLVVLSIFAGNDFRDLEHNALFELNADGSVRRTKSNLVTRALPLTRTQILLSQVFRKRYLPQAIEDQLSAAFIQDKTELFDNSQSPLAAKRIGLMRGVLQLFANTTGEKKISLLVLIMPSLEAFDSLNFANEQVLDGVCEALKLDCLDLTELYTQNGGASVYDPVYRHINGTGAKVAAQVLAERLRLFRS